MSGVSFGILSLILSLILKTVEVTLKDSPVLSIYSPLTFPRQRPQFYRSSIPSLDSWNDEKYSLWDQVKRKDIDLEIFRLVFPATDQVGVNLFLRIRRCLDLDSVETIPASGEQQIELLVVAKWLGQFVASTHGLRREGQLPYYPGILLTD